MKLKQHPMGDQVEPWLQWQIRTLHKAEAVAQQFHIAIEQKFHDQRLSWAGHLARLGIKSHAQHMAHFVFLWRPLFWWREQQLYADITNDPPIRHPQDWGQPRRYEHGWSLDWMMKAYKDHYG